MKATATGRKRYLVRCCFFGCLALVTSFGRGAPSEEEKQLQVGDARVPDTPAFALMGISPTTVAHPSSPKDFAASITSAAQSSEDSWPRNLAVEFSPYWWSAHPDLTWEEYNSERENVGNNLLQTLSLSLGTTESTSTIGESEVKGTSIGFGLRASILKGRPNLRAREAKTALVGKLQVMASEIPDPESARTLPRNADGSFEIPTPEGLRAAQKAFREVNSYRVGLQIDVAAAAVCDFPDDDFRARRLNKSGAWLTAAYRSEEGSFLDALTAIGVVRYVHTKASPRSVSSIDAGVSLVWINSNPKVPVSIAGEYVRRFSNAGQPDDERFTLTVEYRASETYSIVAGFGEAFDEDFDGESAVISSVGVRLSLGRGPVVKIHP